jgi:hypothetical protein
VLLSDDLCRVRVYPGSHVISLDGQEQTLRGLMVREVQGVLIPGPAAGIIEGHVLSARAARMAPPPSPVPAPPPVTPRAAPSTVAPPVVPVVSPAAPAKLGAVSPDPGWVVSPTAREWKLVVVHHSDDQSGCMAKYHQVHLDKGWENGCGYHFVIGNGSQSGDGEVEPSRRWLLQMQGAHAKTPDNHFNDHGIGICLVGDFEHGTGRPTGAQMRALTRLVQWLMDRYDIRLANVRGHCHCGATCCPGKNFPWTELRSRLRDPARASIAQAPAAVPLRLVPAAGGVVAAAGKAHTGTVQDPTAPAPTPAPTPTPAASAPVVTAPAARDYALGAPPAGPSTPVPPSTR